MTCADLSGDRSDLLPRALKLLREPMGDGLPVELVAHLEQGSDVERTCAIMLRLRFAYNYGHGAQAYALLTELASRKQDDPFVRWFYENAKGILLDDVGLFAEAVTSFRTAAAVAASHDLQSEYNIALANAVDSGCRTGLPDILRRDMARFAESDPFVVAAHGPLSTIFDMLGDLDMARRHYGDLARGTDSRHSELGDAMQLYTSGDIGKAKTALAAVQSRPDYDHRFHAEYERVRAWILLDDDPDGSLRASRVALQRSETAQDLIAILGARTVQASALLKLGRPEDALDALDIDASRIRVVPHGFGSFHRVRADALWAVGRKAEALAEHEQARECHKVLMLMRAVVWEMSAKLMALRRHSESLSEVVELNDRLAAASEAMGESAAQVAHDLRSGITVLKMGLASPISPDQLPLMEKAVERTSSMARQALRASQFHEGGPEEVGDLGLVGHEVDLVAVIMELVIEYGPVASRKRQRISFQRFVADSGKPVRVLGTPTLMVQIIGNLIENALHYSERGGCVDLGLERDGDTWVLTVSDDGIGVPEGKEAFIFERFARAGTPTAGESSTGLGLFIVRRSAERLGGSVRCVPTPGPGATFEVRLPVATG